MTVQVPPPDKVASLEDATRTCPQCSTAFCPVCCVDDHRPRRCVECTVSRLAGHNRNPHLYALNELARTNRWRRCPVCRIFTERVDDGDFVQYQFDTRSRKYPHGEPSCLYHERFGPPVSSPDSLCYDLMPKPDSMATLSFSDADEESDADYCPYPDAVNDGNRVLDNPWAPNDWPRAASGYRIMRWGTGHVRFPTKKERKLPKWLARMYLAKMCHYCQHAFPMFADLVNHFHMTKKHHVHLCCNRTFKDEPAYFGHLNDVHGGDIENW